MLSDALRLYLVLDPDLCGGELGMVQTAVQAAEAGVTTVQLRAPQWKKRRYAECGRALLKALAPYRVPLIVNDHVDVAVAIGAQGAHVGQDDLSPIDCRQLMPPEMILGLSVTNMTECLAVDAHVVDYIGIGPVWPTDTKKDAADAVGLPGLVDIVRASPCPSVAIGGITARDVPTVMHAGVDGVAVVSAICGKPDIKLAVQTLLDAMP